MKSLLFAALALSLILMVSAQCDISAITTCTQNYANMVSELARPVCMQLSLYVYALSSIKFVCCIALQGQKFHQFCHQLLLVKFIMHRKYYGNPYLAW